MHIYFSGIGGAGMAPLALIAAQAGYNVSGSDKQDSQYIDYLKRHGVTDVHIGQSREAVAEVHQRRPIDWLVYSSAVAIENPGAPELLFCRELSVKTSKRDELINRILADKNLKLIAVAGTHGKTTTTAMVTWLFKQLGEPVSYLLPAKTGFAEMGAYDPASRHFIYEADEFDRNFLAYKPQISLITGVSWDHHEIFPTRDDYQAAFTEFISQSGQAFIWQDDARYLGLASPGLNSKLTILDPAAVQAVSLLGKYNRLDAWLALQSTAHALNKNYEDLIKIINAFPGLSRRMELIAPNLYSDYAHTPEKIRGAMSVALETAAQTSQKLIVVYEPLTNRRQHYILDDYRDCFEGAAHIYWLPSYLAREDPAQRVIPPEELISHLSDSSIASASQPDQELKQTIARHLAVGDMVVGLAGGGGGSLDDWLRQEFTPPARAQTTNP